VGVAILVNTVILASGFLVMTASNFKVNYDMGMLTAIAIGFALILDFLLLPALLVFFDKKNTAKLKNRELKMNRTNKNVLSTALLMSIILSPTFLWAQETDLSQKGHEISARSDRTDRGFTDSEVDVTMILRNKAGEESSRSMSFLTLEVADESVGDKSLVVFNTPKDVEGTALLSHAKILNPDNQWLYLPALKRVKRISSKNKSGPFVGSEFAFEDFTSTELNKYSYVWLREEPCGDITCDVIERKPKYKYSGYTKQIAWIDQTDYQLRKVDFYDRRDSLFKTLRLQDYKNYDGIWRPKRLHMSNHKNGKVTELVYSDFKFKVGLTDNDFVKGKLTQLR